MSRVWCSDAARARGDDNAGTASRVDLWILVELPTTWGRNPIHDAVLPPDVRDALKRATVNIPRSRVVFIRKRVECLGPIRVYVVRSAPEISTISLDLGSIEELADVPFGNLARSTRTGSLDFARDDANAILSCHPEPPSESEGRSRDPVPKPGQSPRTGSLDFARDDTRGSTLPLVLVCTHGQHDSCCGRRGYPLFDALRRHDELEVWQCSHIGGDRFAANAVVLPWGLYYGPVEPRDARALTNSISRGEIFLPAYRGRCSLSRPVQAAETFIRRATGILGLDGLRFESREELPFDQIRVRFRGPGNAAFEATIELFIATEAARLTCTAMHDDPIPEFRLVGEVRVGV